VYVPSPLFLAVYSVDATGIYPFNTVVTPSFTVTVQSLRFFLSTPHTNFSEPLVAPSLVTTLLPVYPLIPSILTP